MSKIIQKITGLCGCIPVKTCLILIFSLCLFSCGERPNDYDLFENLRDHTIQTFQDEGMTLRSDVPDIFSKPYVINLKGLFILVFGATQLNVDLFLYESDAIASASLNMFEVPPDSGDFLDFAFTFRPSAKYRAPLVHGDVGAAMAGTDGSFSMDFYNLNQEGMDLDEFFGDQISKINAALALVKPYQRQGEDRGKYIQHLVPYSSGIYRIEMDQSYISENTEAAWQTYHENALAAYKLYLDAYFTALSRLEPEDNETLINANKAGIDNFIDILYNEDYAATMGKELFKDDFDTYYLDSFWRDGYYGTGITP